MPAKEKAAVLLGSLPPCPTAFYYGICVRSPIIYCIAGNGINKKNLKNCINTFSGMTSRRPNEAGAITGLLSAMTFLFWIGFGQPKSRPDPLGLSVEKCPPVAVPIQSLDDTQVSQ